MSQPALFVPHGAPTFALEPGLAGERLRVFAAGLKPPSAIVVVSAHWDTAQPAVGTASAPETIHDFWGFADELYDIRYPAPGAPQVAARVLDLLRAAGMAPAGVSHGLDHAVWIPLRLMFADARIPVVPMSVQSRLGPDHHFRLGQALAPLRDEDVLVVASGNLTHNLGDFRNFLHGSGAPPGYVREFPDWVWQRLGQRDVDALLDYRVRSPHGVRAHPTDEHLLPLYVAMGAAGAGFEAERIHDGVDHGVIAMDCFAFR